MLGRTPRIAMALATTLGGGSLVLFGAFIVFGPFDLVRIAASQAGILLCDALLSALFFVQHSAMVRATVRRRLAALVAPHYQPTVYAIASGCVLSLVVLLWQVDDTPVYRCEGTAYWAARILSLLGIAGLVWGAKALKPLDAFGRSQLKAHLRGEAAAPPVFVVRGPYHWVRHPLYFSVLLVIWSAPEVSSDRLLFNLLWTGWIVFGTLQEEKDLVAEFGEDYRRYQRRVPMLLPWRGRAAD